MIPVNSALDRRELMLSPCSPVGRDVPVDAELEVGSEGRGGRDKSWIRYSVCR